MNRIGHIARDLFLAAMFLLLTGGVCEMGPTSDPIDLKDIPGIYESNYNAGLVDKIEVRVDSVYIRYFVSYNGHKFTDSGRYWCYYIFLLRQVLVFAVAKARPDASGYRPSGHHPPRHARGIKDLTEHSK
jgi:hypothetical protein